MACVNSFAGWLFEVTTMKWVCERGYIALLLLSVLGVSHGFSETAESPELPPEMQQAVERVIEAADKQQPAAVISGLGEFNTEQAYAIQAASVQKLLQYLEPAGFKAGLTSRAAQNKFNVTAAVAGVLPPGSVQKVDAEPMVVRRERFNEPMLEAELGFRFGQAIDQPVKSVDDLKERVAEVVPVVELPDLAFDNRHAVTGIDIIANNVLAKLCLVGPLGKSPKAMDFNAIDVKVWRDNELVLAGQSSDAMGDQWQALLWLVNHTLAQGYTIAPGQLLITGAIGRMLPLQAGEYRVEYGQLGQLKFEAR